jgi:hypothetical protein
MKRMKCVYTIVCAGMMLGVSVANSQETPGPPDTPKKPDFSNWWTKSALSYDSPAPGFLYHAEAALSYMEATGNTSGRTFDTRGSFDVRRWRFTNTFYAQVSKQDIIYGFGGDNVDYSEHTVRDQLDFDLTKHVMLQGGVEYYRNTLMFLNNRINKYGGAGFTLYHSEHHHLNVIAALGHASFVFDRDAMLQVNPDAVSALKTTSPASAGALMTQSWRWTPNRRFNFHESATRMEYFHDDLGFRMSLDLEGNVPVSKRFSFNMAYRIKEETNSYIQALRVKPLDRSFTLGIKASI